MTVGPWRRHRPRPFRPPNPRHRTLVVTAAYTGCRIGELIALDTNRHQPDQRIIRIEGSLAEVRGRPAVIASRLGHTSVKTVLDVYGHLYEGLGRNAADTLNPPRDRSDVDAMWSRRTPYRDEGVGLI